MRDRRSYVGLSGTGKSAAQRRWAAACAAAVCALVLSPRAWSQEACRAGPTELVRGAPERARHEARARMLEGDRARSRALYLALLARDPDDQEARVGLARLDAWDGCRALAERNYRAVLARHPENAEARAGLVDILLWERRWDEARTQLADGLERAPMSPDLLSRRARLLHWTGDEAGAIGDADLAARLAPADPELRQARDRLFLGEARVWGRAQIFPTKYDDLYTVGASVMKRWYKLRFQLSSQIVTRTGALPDVRIIDGRRSVGVYYHFPNGGWAGVDGSYTSGAFALPRWTGGISALTPLGSRFSLYVSGAVWRYRQDKTVFLVAPALGFALTDTLEISGRWWISNVVSSPPDKPSTSETVHSLGARVIYRPEPKVQVGAAYTYGVQLDQNPIVAQFLQLRSHIVTVFARRMFTRTLGVEPVVAFERRTNVNNGLTISVPAFQLSGIVRW